MLVPLPYEPSAKIPRARTPQAPLMPWTLTAPTGSSTLMIFSQEQALQITRIPAMPPMAQAPQVLTNSHGAVIATRPASRPLHMKLGSGLP